MVPIAYGRTKALGGATGDRGGMDPRLKPAAHDFEASMMQELLKPMERDPLFSSGNSDGGGLVGSAASASTWSSLGVESLAKAISEAGGLGIATKVIAEVEAEAKQANGTTPSEAEGGTGARRGGKAANGQVDSLQGGESLVAWSSVRRLP